MRTDHDDVEEVIAAGALGGLDDDAAAELLRLRAAHGLDCPDCRRLEAEYREVAGRLAFALDPVPVRPGLEDDVVRAARGPGPALGRRPWLRRWVAGVAAAAVLVVAGGVGGFLLGQAGEDGARVAQLSGTGTGSVALVYEPGADVSILVGAGLAQPPPGKTYQLWMIRDGTPVSAGTFGAEEGLTIVRVPADPSGSEAVAVTIEDLPGVAAPSTDPIFSAPIDA